MNAAEPIKNTAELALFRGYYKEVRPSPRNCLLIVLGLNTALRIGDLLSLRWGDVYRFPDVIPRSHIYVPEQKTGKCNTIALNRSAVCALEEYVRECGRHDPADCLFAGRGGRKTPLSRFQAYRVVREAADYAGIDGRISCHSLRKTFGYHAWQHGAPPALLMNVFNHSSFRVTKRYLCIGQEEKDQLFAEINL